VDAGPDLPLIVGLVILFAVAVFLGAAEAALLRIPRSRAAVAAAAGDHAARRVLLLIENLPQTMNTILLVVLLSQIGAATVVGVLAGRHLGSFGVTAASIALTLVLFVYAEAIPKTLAVRHPLRVSRFVARVVGWLVMLLRPITRLLVAFADLQAPGQGIAGPLGVSEEELRFLAGEAATAGEIERSDHDLIEKGFELGDIDVEEIIVPRLDIVSVAVATPVREALDVAVAAGHRRLPVHEGDLDTVVGAVHLRDLAAAVAKGFGGRVDDYTKPVLIVPEGKRVIDLLREMQATGRHLAIVIDEHGGTSGMATIEDVVGSGRVPRCRSAPGRLAHRRRPGHAPRRPRAGGRGRRRCGRS
jgi:CBS domain containing-hemolysin-like protein